MTERALRDELERLQVEAKGLDEELALEHAPRFLEQRRVLSAQREQEHTRMEALEREVAEHASRKATLAAAVTGLEAELRAVEQERLDALPLVLLVVCAAVATRSFSLAWNFGALGAAAAGLLGLLFGARVIDGTPLGARVPRLQRSLKGQGWFTATLAVCCSAIGGLGAVLLWMPHPAGQVGGFAGLVPVPRVALVPHFTFGGVTQFAALSGLLLALRVRRLSMPKTRTFQGLLLVIAGADALLLLAVAASWCPELVELLRDPVRFDSDFLCDVAPAASAMLPLLPLAALIALRRGAERPRPWRFGLAVACAALSLAVTALTLAMDLPQERSVEEIAGAWLALQVGALAGLLALDELRARGLGRGARWSVLALASITTISAAIPLFL